MTAAEAGSEGRRSTCSSARLEAAGAQAAIVVPLFRDEAGIEVIRMVAPPLRHGRHSNVA